MSGLLIDPARNEFGLSRAGSVNYIGDSGLLFRQQLPEGMQYCPML